MRRVSSPGGTRARTSTETDVERRSETVHAAALNPASGVLRKAVLCPAKSSPSIVGVNGRDKGITFTPGARYVITGCALGDTPGRIDVSGVSTTGQPQTAELKVTSWTADAIVAQIDPGLGGVGDIAAASLQVDGKFGRASLGG